LDKRWDTIKKSSVNVKASLEPIQVCMLLVWCAPVMIMSLVAA